MRARVAVAVVAVVVLGVLGVMERSVRLYDSGLETAGHGDIAAGREKLLRAAELNPDPQPESYAALLDFGVGKRARALAAIERVVRREPDNIVAWGNVARIARGFDPAVEARARAAFRRLDPVGAARARSAAP